MEQNQDQMEIDLREIFRIISKRIWLIVLITGMAVIASGLISYLVLTPTYEASTQILVNQSTPDGINNYSQNEIRTSIELINTYSVVIKSPRILDKVIEDYQLNKGYEALNSQIEVNAVSNSQVMSIRVTDPSYQQAVLIANAVAETFQEEIVQLMKVDNVHIMAEAQESASPSQVAPKPALNIAIAFVVGLMAAVGLVFLLEYLDDTIKTEQDIERRLGLPVLGVITKMEEISETKMKRNLTEVKGGKRLEA